MSTIRPATEEDQAALRELAVSTGLFSDEDWMEPELEFLDEGHQWLVVTENDVVVGAAYVGPEMVSYRLWNTYFLAVAPDQHGHGIGRLLMEHIEAEARAADIATLIVDTSSGDGFVATRAFYEGLGYVKEAQVRDYYGPGDDKITFWKSLAAASN
jgi:ribosomal protein S18 acetylase RimI-like enzyme